MKFLPLHLAGMGRRASGETFPRRAWERAFDENRPQMRAIPRLSRNLCATKARRRASHAGAWDAERPRVRSHAEHGNELRALNIATVTGMDAGNPEKSVRRMHERETPREEPFPPQKSSTRAPEHGTQSVRGNVPTQSMGTSLLMKITLKCGSSRDCRGIYAPRKHVAGHRTPRIGTRSVRAGRSHAEHGNELSGGGRRQAWCQRQ